MAAELLLLHLVVAAQQQSALVLVLLEQQLQAGHRQPQLPTHRAADPQLVCWAAAGVQEGRRRLRLVPAAAVAAAACVLPLLTL